MDTPRATFLTLPPSIRREIYILAGLSRLCPVAIVQDDPQYPRTLGPEHQPRSRYECRYKRLQIGRLDGIYRGGPDCLCPALPKQLLLVNKTIHKEAHDVLYSENGFVVRAHKADDLNVLRSLSGRSISMMTRLLVRLNCWPCPRGHDPANFRRGICIPCRALVSTSDLPLRTDSRESVKMAQAWEEVCNILAANVTAGQLDLTLISDADDVEIAKRIMNRIMKPLESLPQLKSCAIRLGRSRNNELRTLARTTSLQLTATSQPTEQPSAGKSIMDLPPEIRLRILDYTHLGKEGDFSQKHKNLQVEGGTLCVRTDRRQLILRKMCCNECNFTKLDCCCPLRYAAHSAACQCRILPLELMLVSRQMNMDACETLYATNTFVFRQTFVETLKFFQSLRPSTLKLIRHIAFELETDQTKFWNKTQEPWTALVQFISSNLTVSRLIMTIDPFEDDEHAMWWDEHPHVASGMRDTYVGLTQVVKAQLSGLRGYHLKLSLHSELRPDLEESVMGPEWAVEKYRQLAQGYGM